MNITNTVARGNKFEDQVYDLIKKDFDSLKFGVIPTCCRFFKKKKYKSERLNTYIEFDISVEIWPEGAKEFSFLYLIECKDYATSIPGSDVSEFITNVEMVAGMNVKPIIITTTKLQERAFRLATERKLMWILVEKGKHTTKLQNSRKPKKSQLQDADITVLQHELAHVNSLRELALSAEVTAQGWDELIEKFLTGALSGNFTGQEDADIGLKRLSAEVIKNIANRILDDFNPHIREKFLALDADAFQDYLKIKHGVTVVHSTIEQPKGREILGYYDCSLKQITIDFKIVGTDRYMFILAHEASHFFLHADLTIDQTSYDGMQDSIWNPETNRHELVNDRNWIEWQANCLAVCLLMPDLSLQVRLRLLQISKGYGNHGRIFADNTPDNRLRLKVTLEHLSTYFGVSTINAEYRLTETGMLQFSKFYRRESLPIHMTASNARPIGQILYWALTGLEERSSQSNTTQEK
ncbi:MAG: ImmA/IrrE family metallo-endopeptidase [Bacteroidota bacterium]